MPSSSILDVRIAAFDAAWALSSGPAEAVGQVESSRGEISQAFGLATPAPVPTSSKGQSAYHISSNISARSWTRLRALLAAP